METRELNGESSAQQLKLCRRILVPKSSYVTQSPCPCQQFPQPDNGLVHNLILWSISSRWWTIWPNYDLISIGSNLNWFWCQHDLRLSMIWYWPFQDWNIHLIWAWCMFLCTVGAVDLFCCLSETRIMVYKWKYKQTIITFWLLLFKQYFIVTATTRFPTADSYSLKRTLDPWSKRCRMTLSKKRPSATTMSQHL